MEITSIPSFAKINLFLRIFSQYEDGYHNIATLFQSIELHDELSIEINFSHHASVIIDSSGYQIPVDQRNTMYKAIALFSDCIGKKCSAIIRIKKLIPPGSGLGGGSSNAAAVLSACNMLPGTSLSKKTLMKLARKIGADVPYFLYGGTALGTERGDKILCCNDVKARYIIIAFPNFPLSTAEIYQKYDRILTERNFNNNISYLKKHFSLRELTEIAINDLEKVVMNEHAQLKKLKELFQKQGALIALMSGSGSALYGIFRSLQGVIETRELLATAKINSLMTKTVDRKTYRDRMKRITQ